MDRILNSLSTEQLRRWVIHTFQISFPLVYFPLRIVAVWPRGSAMAQGYVPGMLVFSLRALSMVWPRGAQI